MKGNYPISGIPDNIDAVTYRLSPKGVMTAQTSVNYFSEPNIIQSLDNKRICLIWMDSCCIHRKSIKHIDALRLSRIELKRFYANGTSNPQPLDQLILRISKAECRKRWARRRNELVEVGELTSTGRISNPGKYFFLEQVKKVVEELNSRTIGNLALARKFMVMCRFIRSKNGAWKLSYLTPELRTVAKSNLAYLNEQYSGT